MIYENIRILAFVPSEEKASMIDLAAFTDCTTVVCASIEEVLSESRRQAYHVVLLPGDSVEARQWWSVWGAVSLMDPTPSILIYSADSDFEMWSGVLAAGGYDVLVPPFSPERVRGAIQSAAAAYFETRKE